MGYGNDNNTNKSDKRQAIIDFVKSHPECDKEDVIEYCTDKGIASRLTVRKTIDELKENKILKIDRARENSKSYKLTVDSENLLVIIPRDLEEILAQFKDFVDVINKICKEKHGLNYNHTSSYTKDMRYYMEISKSAPSLPYTLIDIINDIYTFYFILLLPKKIDNQNIVVKLYSNYFEYLLNMYSYVSKELQGHVKAYDMSSITKSDLYQTYMKSKENVAFAKVYDLVRICRAFDIEENLYKVLDLLWIKNMESAVLIYKLTQNEVFQAVVRHDLKRSPKDDKNSSNELNNIHDSIDYFVDWLEGSNVEDRMFSN